ncbi:multicopper oxidase domain-containing protein [Streptosporangium sp. NPDC000396]|uniref:multicopper oxidase domain-containing protein n=1 Tax=Streptosporangium sp. NPDC000396 TaxID=3366185 RepID=UPI0036B021C7
MFQTDPSGAVSAHPVASTEVVLRFANAVAHNVSERRWTSLEGDHGKSGPEQAFLIPVDAGGRSRTGYGSEGQGFESSRPRSRSEALWDDPRGPLSCSYGNETQQRGLPVITRFDGYHGRYLLHCHNAEHEDMGMMANLEII